MLALHSQNLDIYFCKSSSPAGAEIIGSDTFPGFHPALFSPPPAGRR